MFTMFRNILNNDLSRAACVLFDSLRFESSLLKCLEQDRLKILKSFLSKIDLPVRINISSSSEHVQFSINTSLGGFMEEMNINYSKVFFPYVNQQLYQYERKTIQALMFSVACFST